MPKPILLFFIAISKLLCHTSFGVLLFNHKTFITIKRYVDRYLTEQALSILILLTGATKVILKIFSTSGYL